MGKIDAGGPAFPFEGGDSNMRAPDTGMTLRDYFAAKALTGLIGRSWQDDTGHVPADVFDRWAKASYLVADAMIAAR